VPTLVLIAGPNGAGKTTFASEYLSAEARRFEFVNADEITRGLVEAGPQSPSDVLAARMMLNRLDELVEANANLVVETTLASLTYARKIPGWRQRGYNVSLA
jgi:predicted ABC-type ATPase